MRLWRRNVAYVLQNVVSYKGLIMCACLRIALDAYHINAGKLSSELQSAKMKDAVKTQRLTNIRVFGDDTPNFGSVSEPVFNNTTAPADGSDKDMLKTLRDVTFDWIKKSQEPESCKDARKLICFVRHECGYLCQLHHVVTCLFAALGSNRTMVLHMNNRLWNTSEFEDYFVQVSPCRCCERYDGRMGSDNVEEWNEREHSNETKKQVVMMAIIDPSVNQTRMTRFSAGSVPTGLLPMLAIVHENPPIWWIGQLMAFILRPSSYLSNVKSMLETEEIPGGRLVGIRIRSPGHGGVGSKDLILSQYMKHVTMWYDKLNATIGNKFKRKVFVSTDDPADVQRLKDKYERFTFLYNMNDIKLAASDTTYWNHANKLGVIFTEIYTLSKCDFVVCSFTSDICRTVYELAQHDSPSDASKKVVSINGTYRFSDDPWTLNRAGNWVRNATPGNPSDDVTYVRAPYPGLRVGNHV